MGAARTHSSEMSSAGLPDKRVRSRLAIIAFATVLAVLLGFVVGAGGAYTPLFYLALIFAAFRYRRRAVYPGVLLAALYTVIEYALSGSPGPGILVGAGTLVLIAYLLGYLFELAGGRPGGLHLRIGEPGSGAPACDRSTRRLIARLSSRDPDTRYRAAGCLGDIGDPAAVGPLAALLSDPESGVRWKAVEALGKLGSPAVGPRRRRCPMDGCGRSRRYRRTCGNSGADEGA